MNQEKITKHQVFYNGRWVDKANFRVFVYSESEQKLVKSYEEYEAAITSGLWYAEKDRIITPKKTRKKNVTTLEMKTEEISPDELTEMVNDPNN